MNRQTHRARRRMRARAGVMLAWLLAALALFPLRALAQGSHEIPDLGRKGSITFEMRDAQGKVVPGGKLGVYTVATVVADDGFRFAYTDAFKGFSEDAYVAEDADVAALAESLAAYAGSQGLAAQAVSVGTDGNATLGEVGLGLYLVVQVQNAPGYRSVSPFTVTVPYAADLSDPDDAYVYDVLARPKCGVVAEADPALALLPQLEKVVSGTGAPTDVRFEFALTRLDATNPLPADAEGFVSLSGNTLTVTRTGAGTLDLGTLTFEAAGTYAYTLSEAAGDAVGFTYDASSYWIAFTVVQDGDALKVERAVVRDGSATGEVLFEGTEADAYTCVFENTYRGGEVTPDPDPDPDPTPKPRPRPKPQPSTPSRPTRGLLARTGDYLAPIGVLVAVGIVLVVVGVVRKRRRA